MLSICIYDYVGHTLAFIWLLFNQLINIPFKQKNEVDEFLMFTLVWNIN